MNDRTEKLRLLMESHQLNAAQVGTILSRKPVTVRIWRCKDSRRTIPENELRLLELTLARKAAA